MNREKEGIKESVFIRKITIQDAQPFILERHYAKRMCPISYAYGAYRDQELIGVVTYGTPASSSLRIGVCGPKHSSYVIELNRLCCENSNNLASYIVGKTLKMLPKPSIVVSYADTNQGHIGYVYQATNFIYTGLSAKRTDWRVKGKEHLHGATIADESRGQENRAQWMRDKYGDDFYLQDRPRKHRYIYPCGNKRQKKAIIENLLYKAEPYPKGETKRYDIKKSITTQSAFIFEEPHKLN